MKQRLFPPLLAACLLLSGCTSLLERSYSVVEPYTDRYWDSSTKDTLRAESYQDLVNSLLMLVEQRTEEGVIRCYEEANSYQQALDAQKEVRDETTLGAYLLERLTFSYETGPSYGTLTYRMTYREGTEDIGSIMTLSDSQSLVDLLRLTVREDREKLTAQFVYDTPREAVIAAVESLWQELCAGEAEAEVPVEGAEGAGEPALSAGGGEETAADGPETEPPAAEDVSSAEGTESPTEEDDSPAEGAEPLAVETEPASQPPVPPEEAPVSASGVPDPIDPLPEEPVSYPPCPWTIQFYPDKEMAAIVEILLTAP